MNYQEIPLYGLEVLKFPDGKTAEIEQASVYPTILGSCDLRVQSASSRVVVLSNVVDTDYRLDTPRVFVFTGSDPSLVMIFGGEVAYRLTSDGQLDDSIPTHRKYADVGLWTTEVVVRDRFSIIIYDTAVLVLDEALNVKWHNRKYLTDSFLQIDGNELHLVDHAVYGDRYVTFDLSTGKIVSAPPNWNPDAPRAPELQAVIDAWRPGEPLSKEAQALLQALVDADRTNTPYAQSPEVQSRFEALRKGWR